VADAPRGLTAERLLRNLPAWWRWARRLEEESEEDRAWAGYSGEIRAVFRRLGLPGDPTARRAMSALERDELRRAIVVVQKFASGLRDETEQRTLIAMWRTHSLPLDWAARGVGLTVEQVRETWRVLASRLEEVLVREGVSLLGLPKSHLGLPVPVGGRGDNP